MNLRIPAILAASFALSAFGAVNATKATGAAESTSPVTQSAVATAEKATGSDQLLADSITQALNRDTSLKGARIKVMASNGDITLSGSVMSKAQSDKAQKIAAGRDAKGKVNNNLSSTG
ncbi:MAG TPA: BON domain-containing protein [Usitatibacter sp.]|nr:BON domain-containing protein [Usitatibacter sp.]